MAPKIGIDAMSVLLNCIVIGLDWIGLDGFVKVGRWRETLIFGCC